MGAIVLFACVGGACADRALPLPLPTGAGPASCAGGPRALDQSQLDWSATGGVSETELIGQSFTVGAAGVLSAIEVSVGPCNGADTSGQVQLELFDDRAVSLGKVTLPESRLPARCGGAPLTTDATGSGFFDLTSLCVPVTVGQELRFIVGLLPGAPVRTCQNGECTGTTITCFSDLDCNGYGIAETRCGGSCDGSPAGYGGGALEVEDPTTRAITDQPDLDLTFKTFVQ